MFICASFVSVNADSQFNYDMSSYQQACNELPLSYQFKHNCSFLGGSKNDGDFYKCTKLVVFNDNVIVAGSTNSNNFPTVGNVFDSDSNGEEDGFIAIFNTDLTKLISCTFLGGSHNDEIRDVILDNLGNIYVVGSTESTDFPISPNTYDDEYGGGTEMPFGSGDLFVAKFNSDLSLLVSSIYLGGSGHEYANAIDLDEGGHVYITGSTSSSDFPVTDTVFSKNNNGGTVWGDDIFISKLSNDLSTLLASTFLGGSGDDNAWSVDITSDDGFIISGSNSSYVNGNYDFYLIKTDEKGNEQWAKTYGALEVGRVIYLIDEIHVPYIGTVDYNPDSYNWPPVAKTNGPYQGMIGEEILFDASESIDAEKDIIIYQWDSGDGTNKTGLSCVHQYSTEGDCSLQLTVIDDSYQEDMIKTQAIIENG